jgi:para-aminobenzoate synthetase component 1
MAAKMDTKKEHTEKLNKLGREGKPFLFLIDFKGITCRIFPYNVNPDTLLWEVDGLSNCSLRAETFQLMHWNSFSPDFDTYKRGFDLVMRHIHAGDTYLLNYTQPSRIETNLTLNELFYISKAKYKICLRDKFVCFSPETFVKIEKGKIFSYPMKGTMDATVADASLKVLEDEKEKAEHFTIVDLIRNDLSRVATNVTVDRFRYLTYIQTNKKNLWQVSSEISGDLPTDYVNYLGDILFSLLPAGSISGAPKARTLQIIEKAEGYDRGFYTGIFGIFDGKNLDSCVLIRYIENVNGNLIYKSGGGITYLSDALKEYEEMVKKVYVPTA